MTTTTAFVPELLFAEFRWAYEALLRGREIHHLRTGTMDVNRDILSDTVTLAYAPGTTDGHGHAVPGATVTLAYRDAIREQRDYAVIAIRQAAQDAIARWDFWEHGGERRARVVRALKRRPFQPRWVAAHCGCPDHTTDHRLHGEQGGQR